MKQLKTLLIAILTLTACTSEDIPLQSNESNKDNSDTFISLEEAIKTAEYYVSEIDENKTRAPRSLKDFEVILDNSSNTRSDKPLYYLINFKDDAGFAVVSADTRLDDVYAFSDDGNISLKDTVCNKALAMFFQSLPICASETNKVITDPLPNPNRIVKVVRPLFSDSVQHWGQSAPFNIYCPLLTNTEGETQHALVGCPAVATGMALSYFEKPTSYNGYSFNWSAMKKGNDNNGVARMFQQIGLPDNLNISYSLSGSGVLIWNMQTDLTRTLTNLGYSEPQCSVLDENIMNAALQNNGPLIVTGMRFRGTGLFPDSGHVWNIDGFLQTQTAQIDPITGATSGYTVTGNYYHCVWGHFAKANGYFKIQNIGTNNAGLGGTPTYNEDGEDGESTTYRSASVRIYYNFK